MLASGQITSYDCCIFAMVDRVIWLLCFSQLGPGYWRLLGGIIPQMAPFISILIIRFDQEKNILLPSSRSWDHFQNWLHLKLQCYVQTCQANTIDPD